MNTLVIGADAISGKLAKCKDGEEGEFVIKGTFHLVGDTAIVKGEVTKKGSKPKSQKEESEPDDDDDGGGEKPRKVSEMAAAVLSKGKNKNAGSSDY